jgi:hypothetical protein
MRPDAMAMAISATAFAASTLLPPQLPVFPPSPPNWDEAVRRNGIDAVLAEAWYGLDGHCATDDEEKLIDEQLGQEFASTYGEITPNGARDRAILEAREKMTPATVGARTVFDAFGFFDGGGADVTFVRLSVPNWPVRHFPTG